MAYWQKIVFGLCWMTLFSTSLVPDSRATDWEQRLRLEAPVAWSDFRERIKDFQYRVRVIGSGNTEVVIEFKQRRGCALRLREELNRDAKRNYHAHLVVVNERYGFEVVRSTPDGPWSLAVLASADNIASLLRDPRKRWQEEIECHWKPCWAGIRDDIFQSNFLWKSVAGRRTEEGLRVRLDFEYRHHEGTRKQGWIEFDPESFWLLAEAEVRVSDSGAGPSNLIRFRHIYEKTQEGLPVLRCQESSHTKAIYQFWKEPRPSEEEFYLPYYGFPEPEELRWRPTPWWLYILLAGLALVILSFGIYAWRRHRRAAFA